jgi:hypothetical protein
MEEIYHRIFQGRETSPDIVDHPITLSTKNCKLLSTKKERYYIHTYNPIPYLDKLKTEYNISEEILSRFDNTIRKKCCNVISITLYINGDCHNRKLLNYLNCIYGTIRNTKRKLPEWLVRVYLDQSIYDCMTLFVNEANPDTEINRFRGECIETFNYIINSENVEIYTFICRDVITLEKTRTYRYLVLIDPEVNISAIREADGYISNLEAHNLKVFERSDKLFYLPPLINNSNLIEIKKEIIEGKRQRIFTTSIFQSYSPWLTLYKNTIGRNFFAKHQNIYDLLAGTFTFKLKFKPEFYYYTVNRLNEEINDFNDSNIHIKALLKRKYYIYPDIQIFIPNLIFGKIKITLDELLSGDHIYFKDMVKLFELGFDEILLLYMLKEIISFSFDKELSEEENKNLEIKLDKQMKQITVLKNLFFGFNIPTYNFEIEKGYKPFITELKENNIIPKTYINSHSKKQRQNNMLIIDGEILDNIICDFPFNIIYEIKQKENIVRNSILLNLNLPYNKTYNIYYTDKDRMMEKYLKYKIKYLKLKKLI